MIEESMFGIHDLSNMELDPSSALPRFNMPLELGLFLGAKRFGEARQKKKRAVILDRDQYRFMKSISDISGQDIKNHNASPIEAIRCVRDWLASHAKPRIVPSGSHISARFKSYERDLPKICSELRLNPSQLTFNDLLETMAEWLKANAET
ncbi:hypothetical protein [Hyphomonas oceanitis]|uniref:hypothetical protein n=1 Tax=Hyphomonas oceanitis TaxID=81033 RepID=UPI00300246B8